MKIREKVCKLGLLSEPERRDNDKVLLLRWTSSAHSSNQRSVCVCLGECVANYCGINTAEKNDIYLMLRVEDGANGP